MPCVRPPRPLVLSLTLATLLALPLTRPAAAIVNGQAPEQDDRRFDAVAAFSHARWLGLDPEHKNAAEHNWFGNATLVAPDVILLAKHLLPRNNKPPRPGYYAVRFRRNKDGSLGSREAGPESYHHVKVERFVTAPGADLALGILEAPVEHIDPMPMRLDDRPLDKTPVLLAGWGSVSRFISVAGPRPELRVGPSIALRPAGAPAVRFAAPRTEMRDWRKNKKTGQMQQKPHVTSDFACANMHDSGGAILAADADGQPALVGVITTYTAGLWIGRFNDDDTFPLHRIAEEGGAALEGLAYAP